VGDQAGESDRGWLPRSGSDTSDGCPGTRPKPMLVCVGRQVRCSARRTAVVGSSPAQLPRHGNQACAWPSFGSARRRCFRSMWICPAQRRSPRRSPRRRPAYRSPAAWHHPRSAPSTPTWAHRFPARFTRIFSPRTTAADWGRPSSCACCRGRPAGSADRPARHHTPQRLRSRSGPSAWWRRVDPP